MTLEALLASGVDVCFANPGTTEIEVVAALSRVPAMRSILGLFEGVVTGAADGYGRMAGHPAATLLHLGPGLGNGLANLHNARRARTPIVNLVGDHASHHQRYDAPLQSDIESLARPVSGWYQRTSRREDLARDAAAAVVAAQGPPGAVSTLVVPADLWWSTSPEVELVPRVAPKPLSEVGDETVAEVEAALRSGGPAALLMGAGANCEPALRAASRVAAATGARLLGETFSARLERGGGLPELERVAYLGEFATAQLQGLRTLVLVEARAPVSFFAYPERPSLLAPEGCRAVSLSQPGQDSVAALLELCERLHAGALGLPPPVVTRGARPTGAIDVTTFAAAVAEVLPEGAIVSDEANTSGTMLLGATASAPRHDWLSLTGGAIGQGLPVATGAAVACPDRPVLCLEADGSAMYTLQALWTQARESLNVTTVLLNNGSYAILEFELNRLASAAGGGGVRQLLSLAGPALDWVALARGLGVAASRATTAEELTGQLSRAMSEPGPALIEVVLQGA